MRIGLSGTGRIGRLCIRRVLSRDEPHLQLGVINTTCSVEMLAHLLRYDSVHGNWDAEVETEPGVLVVNGRRIPVVSERDPAALPWAAYGIELAIDATGKFRERSLAAKHGEAGARRVLLTCPGKDADLTVVMGVNQDRYDPARHRLLSAASCTTNALAPVLAIMDRAFGVERGWMTTIHASTNDQNHLDNPHQDWRRARACTRSIIPTTTGVSNALTDVLPHLASRINGISVRVPTQDVSLLDLKLELAREAGKEDIARAFKRAAREEMGAFVDYNELPLVSSDYVGNEKSAVIDGLSIAAYGKHVQLLAWYDNEWAYACRVIDLAAHIADRETGRLAGGEEAWRRKTAVL